jgi:hypothetical protein
VSTRLQVPAVLPWEESWVRALDLTKPMFITLYDADRAGRVRSIYPGGQWRLIRAGLYRRGLIELDNRLTTCGHVAAIWAGVAVRRTWPDRSGSGVLAGSDWGWTR